MQCPKGIAIAGVFVGHCSKVFTGVFLYKWFCSLGLFSVSLFFFISGYGLMCGIIKQKENYRKGFIWKRIYPLLVTYSLAILLYYVLGGKLTYRNVILCGYVPFSWYILSITVLYSMTYISLLISGKGVFVIGIVSLLLCFFIAVVSLMDNLPYTLLGGGQMITFVIGMAVSYFDRLKIIKYGWLPLSILFAFFWSVQLTTKYAHWSPLLYDAGQYIMSYTFPFVLFGALRFLSLRAKWKQVWLWVQKYTLEIYLVHGCIMFYVVNNNGWNINSEILIFIIFAATLLLALVFKIHSKQSDKLIIQVDEQFETSL